MISNPELYRLAALFGAPEFLKTAELQYDPATLRMQQWADPDARQYPIHTKSACWISNAQFWDRGLADNGASPEVAERLLKAAEFFGILPQVRSSILTKVARERPVHSVDQLPDSSFALVATGNNGVTMRLYPMVDVDTVKAAATTLHADRYTLPLEWRRAAARAIFKQASDRNVNLDEDVADSIERLAGRGMASIGTLSNFLTSRADELFKRSHSKEARALLKVANQLDGRKPSRQLSEKVATVIDAVDRTAGIHRQYGERFAVPEDVCHSVLPSHLAAVAKDVVTLPSGNFYSMGELSKAASELAKMPGAAGTLVKLARHEAVSSDEGALLEAAATAVGVGAASPEALLEAALSA